MLAPVPDMIDTVKQLNDLLSTPDASLIDAFSRIDGDILILGAGGKMGPSLAVLARRALDAAGKSNRVTAVSRFSDAAARRYLDENGVTVIAADMLNPATLHALPDASDVLYLAGRKFGSTGDEPLTWAINAHLPGLAMQRFAESRIVILSTGNVYPLTSAARAGCTESDPTAPEGEYAQSCLGRERIVRYYSEKNGTLACIVRLNYAIDLRYGVLLDIARAVFNRSPVELAMGYVNVIWQGDANRAILHSLALAACPPFVLNVTGNAVLSVRDIAERFAREFGIQVEFTGTEAETALLSNATLFHELMPFPKISIDAMIAWTAHWVMKGGFTYGKQTEYGRTDGRY
jgi:nucleoside-diphosphate-sugar epimerase